MSQHNTLFLFYSKNRLVLIPICKHFHLISYVVQKPHRNMNVSLSIFCPDVYLHLLFVNFSILTISPKHSPSDNWWLEDKIITYYPNEYFWIIRMSVEDCLFELLLFYLCICLFLFLIYALYVWYVCTCVIFFPSFLLC